VTPTAVLRDDLRWCTPSGMPHAVTALDDPLRDALVVGAAGKIGLLDLTLGPHRGVTRVERH
jgi:urease accessory protein